MSNVLALQLLPTGQTPIGGDCVSFVSCPSSVSSVKNIEDAE
jgi:hypothetical protein